MMRRGGSRGTGWGEGVKEERPVAGEGGSVAKETERTWGKDRAGQGWSKAGRVERRWQGG